MNFEGPDMQIDIDSDEDGFRLNVLDLRTKERKIWRLDKREGEPGKYTKYREDMKPTTRTHEIVELDPEVEMYLSSQCTCEV